MSEAMSDENDKRIRELRRIMAEAASDDRSVIGAAHLANLKACLEAAQGVEHDSPPENVGHEYAQIVDAHRQLEDARADLAMLGVGIDRVAMLREALGKLAEFISITIDEWRPLMYPDCFGRFVSRALDEAGAGRPEPVGGGQ